MDRTAALRDPKLDSQREIERVDSEQIFHPLARTDDRVSEIAPAKLEENSREDADTEHLHTKLEKVTAVLKKPFEHHYHHAHEGKSESEARHEADRKDKTSENWMG